MFCKYCGKKMDNVSEACPNCKKEQGSLQATDGFFGVLTAGSVASGSGMSGGNDKKVEELSVVCKRLKNDILSLSDFNNKYRKRVNLLGTFGILMVLLLSFAFAFMYRTHVQRSTQEIEDLMDRVVSLETELQAVSASAQQNIVVYEDTLKQVEANFVNKLTMLEENYEQAIETLREETSKALDSLKQEFEVQLQELKEEYHPIEEATSGEVEMEEKEATDEIAEDIQQYASEGRSETATQSDSMAETDEDKETTVEEGKADE